MSDLQDASKKTFDEFIENISLALTQLRDETTQRSEHENFTLPNFWFRLNNALDVISKEATKLSLAFSQPPYPTAEECGGLLKGLEAGTLSLLSAFYFLPPSQGTTLQRALRSGVIDVITAIENLATDIKSIPAGSRSHLHSTGSVWEQCDTLKALPRDNREAVLQRFSETSELVTDALNEIQEALDSAEDNISEGFSQLSMDPNGDADTMVWSSEDEKIVAPALGLVKAVKSSVKKISGCVKNSAGSNVELDMVCERVCGLSEAVDDLVSALYPPLCCSNINQQAETLADLLRNLLSQISESSLSSQDDQKWIKFLHHACEHNLAKLIQFATT